MYAYIASADVLQKGNALIANLSICSILVALMAPVLVTAARLHRVPC